jgi:N-acetylated-alpha-linked acidic dipeptidase
VNYGTEEDSGAARETGVEVRGKIALVRYGKVFRGLKVREAQQRGQQGPDLLDPADDGAARGMSIPTVRCARRRHCSAARCSSELGPGDPQTPRLHEGREARAEEKLEGSKDPPLPSRMERRRDPARNSPVERSVGVAGDLLLRTRAGPRQVEMHVEMDEADREIWDVIGRSRLDRAGRLGDPGNHHDAWRAAPSILLRDASFLEAARALGAAVKSAGVRAARS